MLTMTPVQNKLMGGLSKTSSYFVFNIYKKGEKSRSMEEKKIIIHWGEEEKMVKKVPLIINLRSLTK